MPAGESWGDRMRRRSEAQDRLGRPAGLNALDLDTRAILWSFSRPTAEPNWPFGFVTPVGGGLWVDSYPRSEAAVTAGGHLSCMTWTPSQSAGVPAAPYRRHLAAKARLGASAGSISSADAKCALASGHRPAR